MRFYGQVLISNKGQFLIPCLFPNEPLIDHSMFHLGQFTLFLFVALSLLCNNAVTSHRV